MDKVILDLADRPFLPKVDIFMLYVALTRVRHGKNIRILPMSLKARDTSGYMKAYSHISVLRFPGMLTDYLSNIDNNHGLFNEVSMRARIQQVLQLATRKYGDKKRTVTDAYRVKDTDQRKPCKTMSDRRQDVVQLLEKPQPHCAAPDKQMPFKLGNSNQTANRQVVPEAQHGVDPHNQISFRFGKAIQTNSRQRVSGPQHCADPHNQTKQTSNRQRVPELKVYIFETQKYPFTKSSIDSCRVHEFTQDNVIDTLLQAIPNMLNSQTNTYVLCSNIMISNLLNNYNSPHNGWADEFKNPCIRQICEYEPADVHIQIGLPQDIDMRLSTLFDKYNVVMSIPINIPGLHFYALVVKSDRQMVTFEIRDSLSSRADHYNTIVTNACIWITAFCGLPCSHEYSLPHVPSQTETDCAFHTVQNCLNVCREIVGDDMYNSIKSTLLECNMWPQCLRHVLSRQTFIRDLELNNDDKRVRSMQLMKSKRVRTQQETVKQMFG